MPLAGGFFRGAPVSLALTFQRLSTLPSHFISCRGMTGAYGSQLENSSLRAMEVWVNGLSRRVQWAG
ncbi:hypothetical protein PR048_015828 [Dryococelus australis]|uniref:Uncharacterized protein n=1 Tax=Dryococelus australis TaxID=614101 RepID=A0ABQ9HI86_9NEOP|nr:hypothetical protein PR048_015828 [Dryococelus australis]